MIIAIILVISLIFIVLMVNVQVDMVSLLPIHDMLIDNRIPAGDPAFKVAIRETPELYWDPTYYVMTNKQREFLLEKTVELLTVMNHSKRSLVDADAGDCWDAIYFAQHGWDVTASTTAITQTPALYGVPINIINGHICRYLRSNRGSVVLTRRYLNADKLLSAGAILVIYLLPIGAKLNHKNTMYRNWTNNIQYIIAARNL